MESNNVYATPKSDVEISHVAEGEVKVYSPTQVACGTFLGGPVGLIYFLMANFGRLGKEAQKQQTLYWGLALIVALIVILPFLPENFPSLPLTIAYVVAARAIAEKKQLTKADIEASETYTFESNWKVFWIALLAMVGSAVVIVGPVVALVMMGVL